MSVVRGVRKWRFEVGRTSFDPSTDKEAVPKVLLATIAKF
jgi:hypothetical protein